MINLVERCYAQWGGFFLVSLVLIGTYMGFVAGAAVGTYFRRYGLGFRSLISLSSPFAYAGLLILVGVRLVDSGPMIPSFAGGFLLAIGVQLALWTVGRILDRRLETNDYHKVSITTL